MSGRLQRLVRRWWAGELPGVGWLLHVVLAPVSWLWAGVTALRNRHWDGAGGVRIDGLTVISVGNLAVGGTGKTPLASWVASFCNEQGRRTTLLLSGYGRDEVLLHRRWTPELPVMATRDRVAGAGQALTRGAGVVVLDDGFQHRRLARALDLVVLTAEDRFPGRRLPRGPYREGPEALRRADGVVVTRRTASEEKARALAERVAERFPSLAHGGVRLAGGRWTDLAGDPRAAPEGEVLAVASVGRPELFDRAVRGLLEAPVELVPFPDHHEYSDRELERLRRRAGRRAIVVTEKDAVKLVDRGERLGDTWVLSQTLEWEWGEEEIRRLILRALGARS